MNEILEYIKNILRPIYAPFFKAIRQRRKKHFVKQDVLRVLGELEKGKGQPKVFYLGITAHSNLGDMAQYYCIHNWIREYYPEYKLIEVEADSVVNKQYGFIKLLQKEYNASDIIVFQSGYTTQDLGGVHDLMHRMVIDVLPNASILMMPQTIFFQHEENRLRSARIYNKAHHMLFLARDRVSYDMAKEMMPDVDVRLFPDIVTSLIGKYEFKHKRYGICLCRRNDGEKYYSEDELSVLIDRFEKSTHVTVSDTTIKIPFKELRKSPQKYIENQIEFFSKFEVVVTDRYHGTIFALAAGTPVVIIKTNDHKVTTGADWFRETYNDYIYVADDLDDAYHKVSSIRSMHLDHKLNPIFAVKYYNKLKFIFESKGF